MRIKNVSWLAIMLGFVAVSTVADAATKKTSKQSAIQNGTQVRAKVEVTGLYDQECYDTYYGCMDQFCIGDNESGGSCSCSDVNEKYEKELNIKKTYFIIPILIR